MDVFWPSCPPSRAEHGDVGGEFALDANTSTGPVMTSHTDVITDGRGDWPCKCAARNVMCVCVCVCVRIRARVGGLVITMAARWRVGWKRRRRGKKKSMVCGREKHWEGGRGRRMTGNKYV